MIRLLLFLSFLAGLEADRRKFETTHWVMKMVEPFTYFGSSKTTVRVVIAKNDQVSICFERFYSKAVPNQDCILLEGRVNQPSYFESPTGRTAVHDLNTYLPSIKATPPVAETRLTFNMDGISYDISFLHLDGYGAIIFDPRGFWPRRQVRVIALVHGQIRFRRTVLHKTGLDVSSCRTSDGDLKYVGQSKDFGNCRKETCERMGHMTVSECGQNEICQQGKSCVSIFYKSTCTFTGPSIVDVNGGVGSVKDRCGYLLMSSALLAGISMVGEYQERRLTDVSFLDTVIINIGSSTCRLEQGGKVKFGGGAVNLTSAPQAVGPLNISKDETGVTAEFTKDGFAVSVFFDGYTAQIHINGPRSKKLGLSGLCAKADSDVSSVRLDADSCTKVEKDPFDRSESCKAAQISCAILKKAPFTSCHPSVSADAYEKACNDTLCSYPSVDNLPCQFLEAYARACHLLGVSGLTGWRAHTKCPTNHKALCQDKDCASREFCGHTATKDGWACHCRPIFSAPYRAKKTLGDPTFCDQNSATASLINCLLMEIGIDYQTLHLNDPSCRGKLDNGVVTFRFGSDQMCKTEVKDSDREITYKNTIKTQDDDGPIVRQDKVAINFSCNYPQPEIKTAALQVQSKTVVSSVNTGEWKYNLTMKVYSDAALNQSVTSVRLNQKVWVEMKATGLDGNMVATVTDSCWATKEEGSESTPRYDLVIKGCSNPKDQTVKVERNGLGTSSVFSFNTFRFSQSNSGVFLHCKVHLCAKKDKSCTPDCKTKHRRSARIMYLDGGPALITMAMTT